MGAGGFVGGNEGRDWRDGRPYGTSMPTASHWDGWGRGDIHLPTVVVLIMSRTPEYTHPRTSCVTWVRLRDMHPPPKYLPPIRMGPTSSEVVMRPSYLMCLPTCLLRDGRAACCQSPRRRVGPVHPSSNPMRSTGPCWRSAGACVDAMAWRWACHARPCHPRANARPSILFRPPDLTTPTTRLVPGPQWPGGRNHHMAVW